MMKYGNFIEVYKNVLYQLLQVQEMDLDEDLKINQRAQPENDKLEF